MAGEADEKVGNETALGAKAAGTENTDPAKVAADAAAKTESDAKAAADKATADAAAAAKAASDATAAKEAYDKLTPEQKAAADKAKADEAAKETEKDKDANGDKSKKDGAPAEYAEFKVPDGYALDKEALAEFAPLAKELNLSQENAQKLVDGHAKVIAKLGEAQAKAWQETWDGWKTSSRADKDIGGDKYDANVALGVTAIKTFGTPELSAVLDATGLGDHPELIRFARNIGKAISEDKLHIGGATDNTPKDQASILFPNQGKK